MLYNYLSNFRNDLVEDSGQQIYQRRSHSVRLPALGEIKSCSPCSRNVTHDMPFIPGKWHADYCNVFYCVRQHTPRWMYVLFNVIIPIKLSTSRNLPLFVRHDTSTFDRVIRWVMPSCRNETTARQWCSIAVGSRDVRSTLRYIDQLGR